MADFFTKKRRSALMAKIRGTGNRSTEGVFIRELRRRKLIGWRRHLPLPGTPDITFPASKVAIFLHGCFWHGCPNCYRPPKTNQNFWLAKVGGNKTRDKKVQRALHRLGYRVVIVWECRLTSKTIGRTMRRIYRTLSLSK